MSEIIASVPVKKGISDFLLKRGLGPRVEIEMTTREGCSPEFFVLAPGRGADGPYFSRQDAAIRANAILRELNT